MQKKLENTCIQMQTIWQFCSAPQIYWVHRNKCITGLMKRLLRGMHFEYFKVFKEEAAGFPSLAQGKEIDGGIVAQLDCFTHAKARVIFLLIYYNNTLIKTYTSCTLSASQDL